MTIRKPVHAPDGMSLAGQVAIIVLVMIGGMTAFESAKQFFLPQISLWQSHLATIGFSALAAGVVGSLILRQREALVQAILRENTERRQAEDALREANEQLETRVVQRTAELAQANGELRESEARYRTISELVSDCAIAFRIENGRAIIDWATDAFTRITGFTLDEMQTRGGFTSLVHPEDQVAVHHFWECLRAGDCQQCEFRTITKNGQLRWLRMYGRPVMNSPEGPVTRIYGAANDITERVQMYESLEQRVGERTHELTALLQVSQSVASTLELKPLLGVILDQLKTLVDYTGAAIWIRQGDELSLLDCRGPRTAEQIARWPVVGYDQVLKTRAPVIVPDIWQDTELARPFRTAEASFQSLFAYAHSWMGLPLLVKEKLIGVLRLDHAQADHFTPRHAHLALAIANQAAIAIENARLYEHAQKLAVLEERQRLARELHDSVSQALYGIELGTRTASERLAAEPAAKSLKADLAEPLDYVLRMARASLAEMRALIFELRPESLETEGLVAGLNKQVTSLRARHRLAVASTLGDEPDVALQIKEAIYRVAREAMHNIVKHAQASQVTIALAMASDRIALHVTDDGIGFDPLVPYPGHLGLQSMRERVASLSGVLDIESAPGRGTHVCAEIPLMR